jgi:hypothetical protein
MLAPGALRRVVALATALAVATPTLALAKAFGSGCGTCPASCPMHRKAKLRCHRGTGTVKPACHRTMSGCSLAAPGCARGAQDELRGPPAVLPLHRADVRPAEHAGNASSPPGRIGRAADPPDTPPPVGVS